MNAFASTGGLESWPVIEQLPFADEPPMSASSSSSSSSDEDSDGSLRAHDRGARKILHRSEFYQNHMPPPSDGFSDSVLKISGSLLVRLVPMLVATLVRRITDCRFNWENKTLQSMLELSCIISVTCAVYSLYHDWLFALEFGTFVGALVTVCDEVLRQFVVTLVRFTRNQNGGTELLLKLGFDIPKNGKAPTSGDEIELCKNVVFGFLGLVAIRSLWEHLHDVTTFTLLTALVGAMFVLTAEFFCLWLPTRRIGLTLQSRFTRIRQNWEDHYYRSFFELTVWIMSTVSLFHTSQDFYWSLRVGTMIAVVGCLISGLEELPDVDTAEEDVNGMSYWQDHQTTDPFLAMSEGLVKSQDMVSSLWKRKPTAVVS